MVLLTITPAAKTAIERWNAFDPPSQGGDNEPSLLQPEVGQSISHGQLIEISKRLRQAPTTKEQDGLAFDLESLLKGARVYTPPPTPKPEKSPEYVALMARLREQEQQRAYERMINPLPPQETFQKRFPGTKTFGSGTLQGAVADDVDETTYADINRQMTLIINVLVTIICCSVGIWITAWHWPTPARLGLSMGGSGVVAAAEVAIYFGYIKRMSDARIKERRQIEAKEVVDTWVFDGKRQGTHIPEGRDDGLRHRKGKHR